MSHLRAEIAITCSMQSRLLFVLIFLLANHWALAQESPAENTALREQARRLDAQLIYRLSSVGEFYFRKTGRHWTVTIAIKDTSQKNREMTHSGTITLKVVSFKGTTFERSRALTETEMSDLVKTVYLQEVFLLPKLSAGQDDLGRFGYSGMDAAGFALERFDARTKTESTVIRAPSESVPFEKVFSFIQNFS